MLLAMQDVIDENGEILQGGLTPQDLKGLQTESKRDGKLITDQIKEYLLIKNIEDEK